MAIRDIFKAKSEPDQGRTLKDSNQILAWFEELARVYTDMEARTGPDDLSPVTVKIGLVGEESKSCTLTFKTRPKTEPVSGQRLEFSFPMDGQRFQTQMTYQGRGNYLEYRFGLPVSIRSAERRDSTRVRIRSRERLSVVVLEDLFQGIGISGSLVDVSRMGCKLLIQRALHVQTERRLPIRDDLMEPGTPLALVRLPDLPHFPLFECGGRVAHLQSNPLGVVMGIAFEGMGAHENLILEKFLASRLVNFKTEFPWKRRFKDLPVEVQCNPESQVSVPEEGPDEVSDDLDELGVDVAEDLEEESVPLTDEEKRKVIQKRGKKLLLAIGDELSRTILAAALSGDGYRCVYEASSLVQILELNRRFGMDVIILDQAVGHHAALAILGSLKAGSLPNATPVVVLQREPDVRLTLAAKGGAVKLLVPQPVDFQGAFKRPLETILGLA